MVAALVSGCTAHSNESTANASDTVALDSPSTDGASLDPVEQHFVEVAQGTSPVMARLSYANLITLGYAVCRDLSNGPLSAAVADAQGAGFDEYNAGVLVGAVEATSLCAASLPDPGTAASSADTLDVAPTESDAFVDPITATSDLPTDSKDPSTATADLPTASEDPSTVMTEPPTAPKATSTPSRELTCGDLRTVSATYVMRSGTDTDATYYWPRVTVHNGSATKVTVAIGGGGSATFNLDPSTAPTVTWDIGGLDGTEVAAHATSSFEPGDSGMYGDATLPVYPGDHILSFTVTAEMAVGDDGSGGPALTCPLRVRKA